MAWAVAVSRSPASSNQWRRTQVEAGQELGAGAGELETEGFREQLVQLVPLAGVVDRHEQVGPLEVGQDRAGSWGADHRVAEGGVHPAQDRGPEHELPDLGSEEVEHVGGEVVHHRPVDRGE